MFSSTWSPPTKKNSTRSDWKNINEEIKDIQNLVSKGFRLPAKGILNYGIIKESCEFNGSSFKEKVAGSLLNKSFMPEDTYEFLNSNYEALDFKGFQNRNSVISKSEELNTVLQDFVCERSSQIFKTNAKRNDETYSNFLWKCYASLDKYKYLPPLEYFLNVGPEICEKQFLKSVCAGDILFGKVIEYQENDTHILQIIATGGYQHRNLIGTNIKAKLRWNDLMPQDQRKRLNDSSSDNLNLKRKRLEIKTLLTVEVLHTSNIVDGKINPGEMICVGSKGEVLQELYYDHVDKGDFNVNKFVLGKVDIVNNSNAIPLILKSIERKEVHSYDECLMELKLNSHSKSKHLKICKCLNFQGDFRHSLMNSIHNSSFSWYEPERLREAQNKKWVQESCDNQALCDNKDDLNVAVESLKDESSKTENANMTFIANMIMNHAKSHNKLSRYKDALSGLELDSNYHETKDSMSYEIILEYARERESTKNFREAEKLYKKSLEFYPENKEAKESIDRLKQLYSEEGKDKNIEELEKLLDYRADINTPVKKNMNTSVKKGRVGSRPTLEEWKFESTCWFYNFAASGCVNEGSSCKKLHYCSHCKNADHGNWNCPHIKSPAIFVKFNRTSKITEEDLRKCFSQFGMVVVCNKKHGKLGFVEFLNADAANKAIKQNGKLRIKGDILQIKSDRPNNKVIDVDLPPHLQELCDTGILEEIPMKNLMTRHLRCTVCNITCKVHDMGVHIGSNQHNCLMHESIVALQSGLAASTKDVQHTSTVIPTEEVITTAEVQTTTSVKTPQDQEFIDSAASGSAALKHSNRNEMARIFVKSKGFDIITEDDLRKCFSQFGKVVSCNLCIVKKKADCFGLIEFENHDAAVNAAKQSRILCIKGYVLQIRAPHNKYKLTADSGNPVSCVVRFSNLPNEVTEAEIVQLCLPFGQVTKKHIYRNKKDRGKCQALLEMCDEMSATAMVNALQSCDAYLQDSKVLVEYSKYKYFPTATDLKNTGFLNPVMTDAEESMVAQAKREGILKEIGKTNAYECSVCVMSIRGGRHGNGRRNLYEHIKGESHGKRVSMVDLQSDLAASTENVQQTSTVIPTEEVTTPAEVQTTPSVKTPQDQDFIDCDASGSAALKHSNKNEITKIFVKCNRIDNITEDDLRKCFSRFGKVVACNLRIQNKIKDSCGCVEFENGDAADNAAKQTGKLDIKGNILKIKTATSGDKPICQFETQPGGCQKKNCIFKHKQDIYDQDGECMNEEDERNLCDSSFNEGNTSNTSASTQQGTKLFVGSKTLENITEKDLRKCFSQFGKVGYCNIPKLPNGSNRNFCFVVLKNDEAADEAIKQTGHLNIKGNVLNIQKQTDDKDKAPGIVACWYYNTRTEGCTNEASHCKNLHICSHCRQSGHSKLNCPQFEGSEVAKDAICSECAQHGHGRLNCPELRKKQAYQLKNVIPALEEWRTERTCWFYNFSSKPCKREALGCNKQHDCTNCHQGGHPHLTCPALLPEGQGVTSKRVPSMDEWKYETSCWFFNYNIKGCSAGVGCKKLHICSECHQDGHAHQECPVAIRCEAAPMEVDPTSADTLLEKRDREDDIPPHLNELFDRGILVKKKEFYGNRRILCTFCRISFAVNEMISHLAGNTHKDIMHERISTLMAALQSGAAASTEDVQQTSPVILTDKVITPAEVQTTSSVENPQAQDSIQRLHQMIKGGQIDFVENVIGNDLHNPEFVCDIEIRSQKYHGVGKSKMEAKLEAAELALQDLMQGTNIFVKSISFETTTEDDVKEFFSQFGKVVTVKISLKRRGKKNANFCFVDFENSHDANKAANYKEKLYIKGNLICKITKMAESFGAAKGRDAPYRGGSGANVEPLGHQGKFSHEENYSGANTAPLAPQGKFSGANTAPLAPQGQFSGANTASLAPQGQFSGANTAPLAPQGKFSGANTAPLAPQGKFSGANTAPLAPQGKFSGANTAPLAPQGKFSGANNAPLASQGKFSGANNAPLASQGKFSGANTAPDYLIYGRRGISESNISHEPSAKIDPVDRKKTKQYDKTEYLPTSQPWNNTIKSQHIWPSSSNEGMNEPIQSGRIRQDLSTDTTHSSNLSSGTAAEIKTLLSVMSGEQKNIWEKRFDDHVAKMESEIEKAFADGASSTGNVEDNSKANPELAETKKRKVINEEQEEKRFNDHVAKMEAEIEKAFADGASSTGNVEDNSNSNPELAETKKRKIINEEQEEKRFNDHVKKMEQEIEKAFADDAPSTGSIETTKMASPDNSDANPELAESRKRKVLNEEQEQIDMEYFIGAKTFHHPDNRSGSSSRDTGTSHGSKKQKILLEDEDLCDKSKYNLLARGLSIDRTREEVKEFFSDYGVINNVHLEWSENPTFMGEQTAYIEFKRTDDVISVLNQNQNLYIKDSLISIQMYIDPSKSNDIVIFVSGFTHVDSDTKRDLIDYFDKFSSVKTLFLNTNSRNFHYAFVAFHSKEAVNKIVSTKEPYIFHKDILKLEEVKLLREEKDLEKLEMTQQSVSVPANKFSPRIKQSVNILKEIMSKTGATYEFVLNPHTSINQTLKVHGTPEQIFYAKKLINENLRMQMSRKLLGKEAEKDPPKILIITENIYEVLESICLKEVDLELDTCVRILENMTLPKLYKYVSTILNEMSNVRYVIFVFGIQDLTKNVSTSKGLFNVPKEEIVIMNEFLAHRREVSEMLYNQFHDVQFLWTTPVPYYFEEYNRRQMSVAKYESPRVMPSWCWRRMQSNFHKCLINLRMKMLESDPHYTIDFLKLFINSKNTSDGLRGEQTFLEGEISAENWFNQDSNMKLNAEGGRALRYCIRKAVQRQILWGSDNQGKSDWCNYLREMLYREKQERDMDLKLLPLPKIQDIIQMYG